MLLITATVASLAATACFGSSLKRSNFLTAIASHHGRGLTAALLELIGAFARRTAASCHDMSPASAS